MSKFINAWRNPHHRAFEIMVVAVPHGKPRARQLRDGRWWIHTGDPMQGSALGWSLPEAWGYWLQLCKWSASQ